MSPLPFPGNVGLSTQPSLTIGNPIVSGSRGECCAKVIHAVIADVGYPNLLLVATGRPVPFLVEVALWGDYI